MKLFCDVKTRNDFADFLKIPKKKLTHVLYIKKVESYYHVFNIPKKNGELRHIKAPTGDLKLIQKKLADALWNYQLFIWQKKNIKPQISHAFEKEKSIFTNATIHKNKKFLLNIDLKDFFDSFHFGRIKGYFEKNKDFNLPIEVATIIAQLTCFDSTLPQGAPSSPIITNMICQILDMRLLKIARKYKCDFTRYADDLSFSSNNNEFLISLSDFEKEIYKEIIKAGFIVNEKKKRLQYKDSKQSVTGLIVNKKLNIDKNYYKNTRAMANCLYKTNRFEIEGVPGIINQLEGRFSFINQIDWYNNKKTKSKNFNNLNSHERQYQKFLFFKYFYANEKPLIITEGKTDILYLKAALKNLYYEYPDLIIKKDNGEFEFKISFLRKSKRLLYFLGMNIDGATGMNVLFNSFYNSKNTNISYYQKFNEKKYYQSKEPVFMLFDNELEQSSKPLYVFTKHLINSKKDLLKKEYCVNLTDKNKLYLLTNQLVNRMKECEIEDLFMDDILNHVIDNKKFTKEDDYDKEKYYGKNIFSKYITKEYRNIDFNNFKSILNNLNKVIKEHNEY